MPSRSTRSLDFIGMDTVAEVNKVVEDLRRKLDAMSYAELAKLPEFETVAAPAPKVQVTVSRISNADTTLSIIIGVWGETLLGMASRRDDQGFRINASGEKSELQEQDYWY